MTQTTTQTTEATATPEQSGWHRTLPRSVGDGAAIAFIVVIQGGCALFFLANILLSVLGLSFRPIPWAWIEYLEIGAAVGLTIGTVLGTLVLFRTLKGWTALMKRAMKAEVGLHGSPCGALRTLGPDTRRSGCGHLRHQGAEDA